MAMLQEANRFIEVIIFTNTPWPLLSDYKYSMVAEAWNLAIEAEDRQLVLADVPVGTLYVC
jgi:hypothetical protein